VPGPLEGIKVIDFGVWVAGPAAAGIMCDWGADVIKIEPPSGDPFRALYIEAVGGSRWQSDENPPFEMDNRGKRSIALRLDTDPGREIALQLLREADVFVTNYRPKALARLRLTYEELSELNPRLVFCHVTGYGLEGPERDRAAYDVGAFWSRAGVASLLTPPGHELPPQPGAIGDHTTAQSALGAICAALVARQRTGRGQLISVSLLRAGIYTVGWDIGVALRGARVEPRDRLRAVNPLVNCYQAGDGRWFWLLLLQADRHWPDLCRAIGREDLRDDPRFVDIVARRRHRGDLMAILDATFATRSLDEWRKVFDGENVWWAPVQSVNEVSEDEVADASGAFVEVETGRGRVRMVKAPAEFYGTPARVRGTVPELGQHTEEILLELGWDWPRIGQLKSAGVIP
jgi:crotonobetainyl-CoA:carnitine CoA-transferase CaiB-like acyl-CoA transferase